ncbi:MAG TPA: Fe-S cluster assembly protein SufD [Chlamydiales bacterium]|jgi:Fe-S cluster assembly protein SufD
MSEHRKKALERFLSLGKDSSWPEPALPGAAGVAAEGLVFVDGYFRPELSTVPTGIICIPLEQALSSYGLFLKTRWAKQLPEMDFYSAANLAHHGAGVFLYVPPGVRLDAPLRIIQTLTSAHLSSPRIQLTLGKNASLSLVQTSAGQGFSNGVIDAALEAGSSFEFLDVGLDAPNRFFSLFATLKRDATLKALHATNGGSRFSVRAQLLEENSSTLLRGLAMLNGTETAEFHALVEHLAPHCTSRQHVKMALQGQSRSHFEGKIYVHPEAQKTAAYQLNNNLLLSDKAVAQTQPNLEIFADDVKASHGATVAELQDEELFYLRSRGLGPEEAKLLLTEGFCREILDDVQEEKIRESLLAVMHGLHHA